MNNITLTHELCAEDRQRIDTLTEALSRLTESLSQVNAPIVMETLTEGVQQSMADLTQPEATEPETIEPEATEPKEWPKKEEPQTPTHTKDEIRKLKDEIRKLVVTLSANGKKDQARAVVLANGKSITDLPDDAIDTVYNALKWLEEQA